MSPFLIFAGILTVGYLIYFGVTIFLDLNKAPEKKNGIQESFDVSDMREEDEPQVVVEEQPFAVPVQAGDEDEDDVQVRIVTAETLSENPPASAHQEGEGELTNAEVNEIGNEGTEPVVPECQFSLAPDPYKDHLIEKHNTREIKSEPITQI